MNKENEEKKRYYCIECGDLIEEDSEDKVHCDICFRSLYIYDYR